MKLLYDVPAKEWEETLPIGNGRLGALIHGGIKEEVIGLNDDRLWNGTPKEDKNQYDAVNHLEQLRQLVYEGRYEEADQLSEEKVQGLVAEGYFPFGNLNIHMNHSDEVSEYKRYLGLDHGKVRVSYDCDGIHYKRDFFASFPAKAIIMRFAATEPFDFSVSFDSVVDAKAVVMPNKAAASKDDAPKALMEFFGVCRPAEENSDVLTADALRIALECDRTAFCGRLSLMSYEGDLSEEETFSVSSDDSGRLNVNSVREVVFAFTTGILALGGMEEADLTELIPAKKSYAELFEEHFKDYDALFGATELYLGEEKDCPTDVRLNELKEGAEDPALYALYFQYGRYLLIASSREGSNPANLQGIWSWYLWAPWGSNYTTNINTEMNYWPAQSCNLTPCLRPYFDLIKKVSKTGEKTAKALGCRGAAVGHNVDLWGTTTPIGHEKGQKAWPGSSRWGMWVMAGGWMCQELWKHYEYTDDVEFLREEAYPALRKQALFLCDWLYEYNGYYVTCPSTSPENVFRTPAGGEAAISMASTMDLTIIREVFDHFVRCCEILKIQDELLDTVLERLTKLYPFKIGKYGQLQEWFEDFDEIEIGHRHVSHLYGLFPGEMFCNDKELTQAAKKSLMRRLEHGGGYTGWSCAWIINLFAILGDGERAYEYLEVLLKRSTYPNLWDAHPPFQIDGNFGGTAGIANMLVQDRGGKVKILPALPPAWKNGYVKGLRIKHNQAVDIYWENGKLKNYRIYKMAE